MKPGGPQSICWPVLDENSKEQFSKERPCPDNTILFNIFHNFLVFVHPPRVYIPTKLVRISPYRPIPGFLLTPNNRQSIFEDHNFGGSDSLFTIVDPNGNSSNQDLDVEKPSNRTEKRSKLDIPHQNIFLAASPKDKKIIVLSASHVKAPAWLYYQVCDWTFKAEFWYFYNLKITTYRHSFCQLCTV